jgi:O-methyltransferase involved in polyketide biosynthesis
MSRPHSETISPTAHYTGYVWFAHGHSHEAFATRRGRMMYRALRAPNAAAHAVGLPTLEGMLLARHRLIDLRLAHAIDAGEVSQIVEVAAGLSPRGWRFRERYGDRITYIEADLPGMIANKRRVLAELGGETTHHRTVEVDALRDDGPSSIAAICASLDPARGTAIITEGLVNYFAREHVAAMWRRFAAALAPFPRGLYLSDIVMRDGNRNPLVASFGLLLGAFVRGRIHLDFTNADDVEATLAAAGLDGVVLDPRQFGDVLPKLELAGAGVVRVIEATPH